MWLGKRGNDASAIAAYDTFAPANNHLRREDTPESQPLCVVLLPRLPCGDRKSVLPSHGVPIGHMKGKCDHIGPVGQLTEQRVSRWTGVTALRSKQLYHDWVRGAGL